MRLRKLVGAGDRVIGMALPFAAAGIAANVVWPRVFRMGFGRAGLAGGVVLLVLGVPLWLWAVAQVLISVPRGQLITTGPYAVVLHPIYVFVALLVIPGAGLVFDTWLGFVVGGALYLSARLFAPREERELAKEFPAEYSAYRARVLLPWL